MVYMILTYHDDHTRIVYFTERWARWLVRPSLGGMCRNITALRGLDPAATPEEIEAAALQYVRKVGGLTSISVATRPAVDEAVAEIAAATTRLLAVLPDRKVPPKSVPPLRRPEVQARIAARG